MKEEGAETVGDCFFSRPWREKKAWQRGEEEDFAKMASGPENKPNRTKTSRKSCLMLYLNDLNLGSVVFSVAKTTAECSGDAEREDVRHKEGKAKQGPRKHSLSE